MVPLSTPVNSRRTVPLIRRVGCYAFVLQLKVGAAQIEPLYKVTSEFSSLGADYLTGQLCLLASFVQPSPMSQLWPYLAADQLTQLLLSFRQHRPFPRPLFLCLCFFIRIKGELEINTSLSDSFEATTTSYLAAIRKREGSSFMFCCRRGGR